MNTIALWTAMVTALFINPTLAWIKAWWNEWCAYQRSGRFNFDGKIDTDDWANKRDPANGSVSLIKIAAYIAPKSGPGTGQVVFYSLYQGEESRHTWRLTKWEENIENLSEVTQSQAKAIEDAGNNWPEKLITLSNRM